MSIVLEIKKLARKRRHKTMRRIVQKSGNSCGVACVAMLARISFRDAFRVGIACYDREWWSETHATDSGELRKMLAALGWKLGNKVACNDWEKVPPGSLAATQFRKDKNFWHWVVRAGDEADCFILDPNRAVKRKQRRDLERMKLAWYHKISRL